MVFRCVFYGNWVKIHDIIIIFIFTGKCRSMQKHVSDVVIDMKIIYIGFFIIKVHQRVIQY